MTALWTAADLLEATGGAMNVPFDATGVSIDTRSLARGDLFVALLGEHGDGHRYVTNALAQGAAGAMVHEPIADAEPLLIVDDTLAALARLGGYARTRFTGRVVAVTGSVGKTTTKEMLRGMLAALGPTHAATASHNNHWGLPLTLARLPREAKYAVAEIGMNHAGEIAPLAQLARPHVAVITAIEKAHVGYLGSIEAIADEKASLLTALEPGGVAVLPIDSPLLPRLRAMVPDDVRVIGFGSDAAANVRLIDITMDADGSDIVAELAAMPLRFRLNAPGRHMAMNALAALAAAHACATAGVGQGDAPAAREITTALLTALEAFRPMGGRGARRRINLPGGTALLLDESYNGNGASMRAALAVLGLQPATRRVAVLGDMLELGDAGPTEHASLAADVIAAADRVFCCGPLMQHLYNALPAALRAGHASDSASLAPLLAGDVRPGDAILVKGSLGSRMKRVVDALDAMTPHGAEAA